MILRKLSEHLDPFLMLSLMEIEKARAKAILYYQKAGIFLTETEKQVIEVADFELSDLYDTH